VIFLGRRKIVRVQLPTRKRSKEVIIMGTIKSDETLEFAEYLRRMRTTTQENVDQTAEKHGRQLRYQAREIHAAAAH
jgi:hypothetical protein